MNVNSLFTFGDRDVREDSNGNAGHAAARH
jgi:hypothetical protein